jgi:hypothetical protein
LREPSAEERREFENQFTNIQVARTKPAKVHRALR